MCNAVVVLLYFFWFPFCFWVFFVAASVGAFFIVLCSFYVAGEHKLINRPSLDSSYYIKNNNKHISNYNNVSNNNMKMGHACCKIVICVLCVDFAIN